METNEAQWRCERRELYEKLQRSAEKGLNREAVVASRELFTFDASGRAAPKEFAFERQDDAVTVVCAEIPRAAAEQWSVITDEVLEALGGGGEDVYVSDRDIMHVTLFYTSHPDDLAPSGKKSERLAREISLLRELATQFEPIRMTPAKVVLTASGAVLLLLQCVEGGNGNDDEGNGSVARNAGGHAEFGVDLLRQAAVETFPFVSKKSPTEIIHTTLARVLSPEAFDETALDRARQTCQRISQQLAAAGQGDTFVVDKLWYVDESHFIRPTGYTTTISLGV
ncbi:uncharacterized protein KRP23_14239 [Phytophthora ramorum]|uniref:uncharacterized protein n=1 Tax=Phytophthora ramorum TaxID=164328 RepID=UPI0030A66604|nr:hypothetical protein KRP23_14239 [Phytophthora ramorum]